MKLWTIVAVLLTLFVATCTQCHAARCKDALFGWATADGTRISGTLANEGGWVNNPDDPGGETYRGITRKFDPQWRGWPLVAAARIHLGAQPKFGTKPYYRYAKALNKALAADETLQELVVSFYHDGIWAQIHGDEIISQYLAFKLFDLATNMGTGTAIMLVEKTINDLNGKDKDFPLKGVVTAGMVRWLNTFTEPEKLAGGSVSNWRRWCFFSQLKLTAESRYGTLISRNAKLAQFWDTWDERNRLNK